MDDSLDIVSITLNRHEDKGPLQMISGEALAAQREVIAAAADVVRATERLRIALDQLKGE